MKKKDEKSLKNNNFIDSFDNALNGLIYATTTQGNIKRQLIMAVGVLILSLFYKLETTHFLCLTFAVFFVIFAEMINTAIETVVDLYVDQYHPKAKIAKDVAAGAVLLTAINSVIVAYFIFFNETLLGELSQNLFKSVVESPKHLVFTSIILVVISILIFKTFGYKNLDKQKDKNEIVKKRRMPSGQTAIAFAILTAIWINTSNFLIFTLSLVLSLLVFENRMENKTHTLAENIFGAFMGILIVLMIFGLTLIH